MKRSRQGFELLEIMVALAIIIVPLFASFSMMRSNAQAVRVNSDQLSLNEVVMTLVERLSQTPASTFDGLTATGNTSLLNQLILNQVQSMPESLQAAYQSRFSALVSSMSLSVQKDVGGHDHLYEFVVTVQSNSGVTVRGIRVIQINA